VCVCVLWGLCSDMSGLTEFWEAPYTTCFLSTGIVWPVCLTQTSSNAPSQWSCTSALAWQVIPPGASMQSIRGAFCDDALYKLTFTFTCSHSTKTRLILKSPWLTIFKLECGCAWLCRVTSHIMLTSILMQAKLRWHFTGTIVKHHQLSPVVTDYRRHHWTLLPVQEINLKAYATNNCYRHVIWPGWELSWWVELNAGYAGYCGQAEYIMIHHWDRLTF